MNFLALAPSQHQKAKRKSLNPDLIQEASQDEAQPRVRLMSSPKVDAKTGNGDTNGSGSSSDGADQPLAQVKIF